MKALDERCVGDADYSFVVSSAQVLLKLLLSHFFWTVKTTCWTALLFGTTGVWCFFYSCSVNAWPARYRSQVFSVWTEFALRHDGAASA
jgi:hypothetical protein